MKSGTIGILGGTSTTIGQSTSEVVEKKPTSKNTSPVRGASPTKVGAAEKKDAALTLQSQTSFDPRAEEEELKRKELQKYGRMMIWEEYYHPGKIETWLNAFEKLRHINTHVIQDMEDFIMLEAFKDPTAKPKTVE